EQMGKGTAGLVTGLSSLATATNATWVAVARDQSDRLLAERGDPASLVTADGTQFRVSFVDADPMTYDLYYNVVSNPLLWFIQHYLWDLAREPLVDASIHRAWSDGYVRMNRRIAERVVAHALAADLPPLIFVQDYQLYCVPKLLRE